MLLEFIPCSESPMQNHLNWHKLLSIC